MRMVRALALAFCLVGAPVAVRADADFGMTLLPWLRDRCLSCHNAEKANGGVDFSAFKSQSSAKARYDVWKKAAHQVRSGAMPPNDPLDAQAQQPFAAWFDATFDTSKRPDPGPPLIRPLTRHEYSQTMRDLLRINFDAAGEAGISEENVVEGFPNRAASLVLESTLMEKYFVAADLALERLFADPNAAGARKSLLIAAPAKDLAAEDAARKVLAAFLRRAFRRPVTPVEIERYAKLSDAALKAGDGFETAIRKAMKPALVSPHFLLRIESSSAEPGTSKRVDDHELAVRLSYFLWGAMPDADLMKAADEGQLSDPIEMEKHVRRMLKNDRSQALTSRFLAHWLQLPHLRKALPSQNTFPTFTRSLRDAMERETWLFCDHLRREDRSILELLDSDYTFVNAELARHYKLDAIPEKDFAKVTLKPEHHRGGVLGMGSMLAMTSHTDRTKPTARGKWILEVLLGAPPPPPPANAGSFAPTGKNRTEPASFREKLALHASDRNCVGCHRRVDPLGFALENFDAVGAWRDQVGAAPVDNVGTLPGAGEFKGLDGLRKILRGKKEQFVSNVAAQSLAYALGRDLSYYDEPSLKTIVEALVRDDYRFSTLIVETAKSYPFQYRKAE